MSRPARKGRDLIGLLVAHGARMRRAARPPVRIVVLGAGVVLFGGR
jgi:hypothetical protein